MNQHALRLYRIKHQISLEQLAVIVGTTRATLSRVETGTQQPSMALLKKIIMATGGEVSADDFITFEDAGDAQPVS